MWEGQNRRKFPRAKFPCLVKLATTGNIKEVLLTHTENISAGGVGLIIKRQLDIFTPLSIEIDFMDGGEHILCCGKVVWSIRRKATEEIKPSFYDVGVEFVDMIKEDRERIEKTIDRLMKPFSKAKI
ncbi:MAG: PilZ domain-containing protein [Candidatus Omnitrophica bacterium]|nr:PilZ domain-containing protein [Candidatus Omnitrophota bacterium]